MRQVGFYIRVSTEKQAREAEGSLVSQKQRLDSEVSRKNAANGDRWGEVVRVYIEEGRSGKDTNRPEYQKMVQDIQDGVVNTIMVTELSRLSRSVSDFLKFMELLREYNADFICPQYDFDTTNAAGRVFVIILMALSQFERELTGERTRNNFFARALRGLSNGGHPILGYDRDPANKSKRIINEAEAITVRRIFDLYLETGSVRATTDAINETGARSKGFVTRLGEERKGKPFVDNSIHGILTNVAYTGKREVNKANKGKNAASLKETERYQIVDATWPAIVDVEKFAAVQGKLGQNRELVKYDQWKVRPFIFSKMMKCLECGGEFRSTSAHGRSAKYSYYRHVGNCPAKIRLVSADDLEKAVLRRLKELDITPYLLESVVQGQHVAAMSNGPRLEQERRACESEVRQIEEKVDALMDRIASLPKEIDAEVLIRKVQELQTRKTQISDNIVRLKAELDSKARKKLNPEEVRAAIRYVNTHIADLSPPLKRDLVRRLIAQVELGRENLKVTLNPQGLGFQNADVSAGSPQKRKPAEVCFNLPPVCLMSKLG